MTSIYYFLLKIYIYLWSILNSTVIERCTTYVILDKLIIDIMLIEAPLSYCIRELRLFIG